jgi:hypothetical protein
MPTLPIDDRSVARAMDALRSGCPVVVPGPSPLAYAVTGSDAAAVNTAKKRPASQPVGVSLADIDVIAAYLDLADGVLPLARWLCEAELVSLMAPIRPGFPGWLAPAVSDGMVSPASHRPRPRPKRIRHSGTTWWCWTGMHCGTSRSRMVPRPSCA